MAAVAAPPALVVAPPAVVAQPAASVKNELSTLKVGVFGSLKKGENWQPYPPNPPNEPPFKLGNTSVAQKRAPGKQVYSNMEYTNYDVDAVPADFKDATGNPIATIDQVTPLKKQARFYGKTQNDPAKIQASFQTSLKDFRKKQFTVKLAAKKTANKAALNVRQKEITTGTQSELDEMTKVYTAKKTGLQRELEKKFKEHKQRVLDNKEQVAYKRYDKPPYDKPPRDLLAEDLQKAGEGVIGDLLKPRATRRRHRFIHLLVKPGDTVVPAPVLPDTRTPENIALAEAQAKLAASEAALKGVAAAGAGAGAPGAGAGAPGAGAPGAGAGAPGAGAGAPLLKPLQLPPAQPGSPGPLISPPASPLPQPPPPPSPGGRLGGGSRKRKTKRKKPHRSSK